MVKLGFIGLGKMGMSHLSILGAYKNAEVVGVCDNSGFILGAIKQLTPYRPFTDYKELISEASPEAVIISTPSHTHFEIAKYCIEKHLHIFLEKPFSLNAKEGNELAILAERNKIVNQVGYHNRFIGTFNAARKWINDGLIGQVFHIQGESNGSAIIHESKSWRSTNTDGGGCLLDYGSHVINLMSYFVGPVQKVNGATKQKIFSPAVEDVAHALFSYKNNITGTLKLNWSDETFRRMTTVITINGKRGKIIVDSQEVKLYLNYDPEHENLQKGWNIRYITDFPEDIDFFVRGEEYTAQFESFMAAIEQGKIDNRNCFAEAAQTLAVIDEIKGKE